MAGTLRFDLEEVRKLYDHAKAAEKHRISLAEREQIYGEDKMWERQPGEESKASPNLFLVKDQGVYLMSSGIPYLPREGSPKAQHLAYARGLDPSKNEFDDWYDRARRVMGGDDCSEPLSLESFQGAMEDPNAGDIGIKVTARRIRVGYHFEKPARKRKAGARARP